MSATGSTRAWAAVRRALGANSARVALGVLVVFVVVALFAKSIAPYDPATQPNPELQKNLAPSVAHPFGTDPYSRDVLSRVIWGSRVSLGVAAASVFLALTIGASVGMAAGYGGGWLDLLLMRLVDAMLSVPRVLLLLVLVASAPPPPGLSVRELILALGLTGWAGMSRIVRSEVRAIKQREFILAARATGVPAWRIVTHHLLPGVVPYLLVVGTLAFATVIPLEAGLSFLGLGVQEPVASWGSIVIDGADDPRRHWWLVLFPGLAIVATVLAVNTLGERLREAVDSRQLPPR